jgi:SAM-dependent methyltransferase
VFECDAYLCEGREKCLGELRPLVCRQFPLAPSRVGLVVHKGCSAVPAMSWSFIMQVERLWRQLMNTGPEFQVWASALEAAVWSGGDYVPLWSVRRGFDAEYASRFGGFFAPELRQRVLDLGWVVPGDKLLDVGCGVGAGVKLLVDAGVEAFGVDVNADLVDRVRCFPGDARELSVQDRSYDVVLCADVLEHLDDWRVAVGELLRVSRGRVVVYVGALEESGNLFLDPTHRVFMPFSLWLEHLSELADIEAVDWWPLGVLLRKRVELFSDAGCEGGVG